MAVGERDQRYRFLIHDRDTKFGAAFDEVFRSEGIEVIRTPIQAPNAWGALIRTSCKSARFCERLSLCTPRARGLQPVEECRELLSRRGVFATV